MVLSGKAETKSFGKFLIIEIKEFYIILYKKDIF